ncbi:MAG: DUF6979 family protein [Tepidisphaeraceae bacterium]
MKNQGSSFARVAVRAASLCASEGILPANAWDAAAADTFGSSTSNRAKSCPRGAFLGLCEDGLLKGIPRCEYTKSQLNKAYATKAVAELRRNPSLAEDPKGLWSRVRGRDDMKHNAQMDVVLALWTSGLIR